ncbi:MAG: hypothetical protein OXQ28_04940 [Acidobacteriota bacterium]|nr:hypothetical protein [Acidobacteriota bacterium]
MATTETPTRVQLAASAWVGMAGIAATSVLALFAMAESMNARMDVSHQEIRAQIGNVDARANSLAIDLAYTRGRLEDMRGDLDFARGQLDGMREDLGSLRGQLRAVREQLDAGRGNAGSLPRRLAALHGDIDVMRKRFDAMLGQLDVPLTRYRPRTPWMPYSGVPAASPSSNRAASRAG